MVNENQEQRADWEAQEKNISQQVGVAKGFCIAGQTSQSCQNHATYDQDQRQIAPFRQVQRSRIRCIATGVSAHTWFRMLFILRVQFSISLRLRLREPHWF